MGRIIRKKNVHQFFSLGKRTLIASRLNPLAQARDNASHQNISWRMSWTRSLSHEKHIGEKPIWGCGAAHPTRAPNACVFVQNGSTRAGVSATDANATRN